MKIQNKEVKFDFVSAARYDELAFKKEMRSLYDFVVDMRNEFQRLELKFGKAFDKLSDKEREEFDMKLNTAEVFMLAQATLGLTEVEAGKALNKELGERSLMEIASGFIQELMISDLFRAASIQVSEDENPSKPK